MLVRPSDYLNREDYVELYGDHWVTRSSRKTRLLIVLMIVGWIAGAAFLSACDSEAAENTALAEQAAHEEFTSVRMKWWESETHAPIKASQANVTITVCQQTDSTINWYCGAGK